MENLILEILVPTYNRAAYLKANLDGLLCLLNRPDLKNRVNLIVSNNASSDDTFETLSAYTHSSIRIYNQTENIGLENNALFVLEKAKAPYVMYLGDDDFLCAEYIIDVIRILNNRKEVSMIVPNFELIDDQGDKLNVIRDIIKDDKYCVPGSTDAFAMSLKCHQLSGVVYKRELISQASSSASFSTLYPFIFWGCVCAKSGQVVHITKNPVKVTHVAQAKKDWDYGADGLLVDKMICYKHATPNFRMRFYLEAKTLHIQSFAILSYLRKGVRAYFKLFTLLIKSESVSLLGKLYIPFFALFVAPIMNIPRIISLALNKFSKRVNKAY